MIGTSIQTNIARWSWSMPILVILLTETSTPNVSKNTNTMHVAMLDRWDLIG